MALPALPATGATEVLPDPALRRSEHVDLRRLGKVSEDERSVLRIEWRVGLARADEAKAVGEMIDRIQRMEATIAATGEMFRKLPAQRPVATMIAPPAPDPDDDKNPLVLGAGAAAAGIAAFWWLRRRKSDAAAPGQPSADPVEMEASPPAGSQPEQAPNIPPTAAAGLPAAEPPAEVLPPPPEQTSFAELAAQTVVIERIDVPQAPTGAEPIEAAPQVDAAAATSTPAAPVVIDFSLEEADPETVAREEAREAARRAAKPALAAAPPAAPASLRDSNIEPTLQLAEIMLSMGLEKGAAQALFDYAEANPRHALDHWLKLLGIYRKRGLHAEFAETAARLRKHFNIQAEDWTRESSEEAPTLEKFARIAEHVQSIWMQPTECIGYLRHLLEDNREGARAGFPQAVAEEFLLLIEVQKELSAAVQAGAT